MKEEFTPEAFLEKANTPPVAFAKMALLIDKYGENAVYCFVEGYDMPYYMSPIRLTLHKEPIEVTCGGKDKVVATNLYIESKPEYARYIKRYFVDRDYTNNEYIPETVFITDGYAIENYYLSESCVSKILKNEFKIDPIENKLNFDRCIKLFHDEHEKFLDGILLFNAWYCRLHEDSTWLHKDVSLEIKFPENRLDCHIGGFSKKYTLKDIYDKYPSAPIIEKSKLDLKITELKEKGPRYVRGKYEMHFLFIFLSYLKDEPRKNRFYTVKSCSLPFNLNTMISTFSQYADISEALIYYITTGKRI